MGGDEDKDEDEAFEHVEDSEELEALWDAATDVVDVGVFVDDKMFE